MSPTLTLSSELVAQADSGIEVGDPGARGAACGTGASRAVGQSAVVRSQHGGVRGAAELLLPGHAGIEVHVACEPPVKREGDHVDATGAACKGSAVGRASGSLERAGRSPGRNIGELRSREPGTLS